jgi:hypothetical protein
MKTPLPNTVWPRLTVAARLAPSPSGAAAPSGFATRVVALAFARQPDSLAALCDFFSWRALAAAALIAFVSVAANLGSMLAPSEVDDVLAVTDPVAEVLSLT